jgi:D-Tyr-tRNAtyr deacylase
MAYTRNQAKALCTAAELTVFDKSQAKMLKQLSDVQVKSLVVRSRTLRDKWRDVSRDQKRTTQTAKGQRQTLENARSADKAALFEQVHQAFVQRLADIEAGKAKAPAGVKMKVIPKKVRATSGRAARAEVKDQLDQARDDANAKLLENERSSKVASSKKKPAKKIAKKPTTKKASSSKKAPVISKNRKKRLALQEEIRAANPATGTAIRETSHDKKAPDAVPPKTQIQARNRAPHAAASQKRVARGGGTRVKAHISSANKRSQSRRDSKG